jgi:hypothetical protein
MLARALCCYLFLPTRVCLYETDFCRSDSSKTGRAADVSRPGNSVRATSLVLGCVITGGAQGFGWMGSSESVGRLAPPDQRASVMSAFYVVAYAGVALPVLAVGVGADWVGLPTAVSALAVAVTVTAPSLVACLLRPDRACA